MDNRNSGYTTPMEGITSKGQAFADGAQNYTEDRSLHDSRRKRRAIEARPPNAANEMYSKRRVVVLPMTRFALAKRMLQPISKHEAGNGNLIETILHRGSTPVSASWGFSNHENTKEDIYTMPARSSVSNLDKRKVWRNGLDPDALIALLSGSASA